MLLAPALLLFFAARNELRQSLSWQLEVLISRITTELDKKMRMCVATLEAMTNQFPLDIHL